MEFDQNRTSFEDFVGTYTRLDAARLAQAVDDEFREELRLRKTEIDDLFWPTLFGQLSEEPPELVNLLILLDYLRADLLCVTSCRNVQLVRTIAQALDVVRVKGGAFSADLSEYSDLVIHVIKSICGTSHIEHANLEKTDKWKRIFEIINSLKKGMARYRGRPAPYLELQSAAFERCKFAQFYTIRREMGSDGLAFTKQWLAEAFQKRQNGSSSEILTTAYLDLLFLVGRDENVSRVPEVDLKVIHGQILEQDMTRLLYISDGTLKQCLFCTIATSVGSLCNEERVKKVEELLIELLEKAFEGIAYGSMMSKVADTTGAFMDVIVSVFSRVRNISIPPGDIYSKITTEISPTAPRVLFISIYKEIHDLFREVITSESVGDIEVSPSLSLIRSEILSIAGYFARLTKYNLLTFGYWFDEIIFDLREQK